jgi:hypothetical protein
MPRVRRADADAAINLCNLLTSLARKSDQRAHASSAEHGGTVLRRSALPGNADALVNLCTITSACCRVARTRLRALVAKNCPKMQSAVAREACEGGPARTVRAGCDARVTFRGQARALV